MDELIKELEQSKYECIRTDYILEKLKKINVYEEYIKGEIKYNIETMINDELYSKEYTKKLMNLTEEDINNIFENIGYNDYDMGQLNEEIEYELEKYIED